MRRRIVVTLALGGLLILAAHTFSRAQTPTTRPTLVGTWVLTLTPTASPTAEPSVTGLATFTSDQSVIETDTNAAALRLTPGHGVWQLGPVVGHWYVRFNNLESSPNGTLRATRITTITGAFNATGNQITGSFYSELIDPSGHVVTSGSGDVTGQLMQIPLLP
jgi:hypothetical protein